MGQRPRRLFTVEDRRMILRMAAAGATQREIGAAVDRGISSVKLVLGPAGGVYRRAGWVERPRRGLGIEQRIEIALGVREGLSFAEIGQRIGRHRCSVWREGRSNGGRGGGSPPAPPPGGGGGGPPPPPRGEVGAPPPPGGGGGGVFGGGGAPAETGPR